MCDRIGTPFRELQIVLARSDSIAISVHIDTERRIRLEGFGGFIKYSGIARANIRLVEVEMNSAKNDLLFGPGRNSRGGPSRRRHWRWRWSSLRDWRRRRRFNGRTTEQIVLRQTARGRAEGGTPRSRPLIAAPVSESMQRHQSHRRLPRRYRRVWCLPSNSLAALAGVDALRNLKSE